MELYTIGGLRKDELCHHGVQDQKWGIRRYQNMDGSLTALGRIHYGVAKQTASVKAVAKYASKRKKNTNVSLKEEIEEVKNKVNEKRKADYEEEKTRYVNEIIKKGTTKDILNNKHLFTNEELANAFVRKSAEEKIQGLADREKGKATKFVEKIASTASNVQKAYSGYDIISSTANKVLGATVLPLVGEKASNERKKSRTRELWKKDYNDILNNVKDISTDDLADLSKRASFIQKIEAANRASNTP